MQLLSVSRVGPSVVGSACYHWALTGWVTKVSAFWHWPVNVMIHYFHGVCSWRIIDLTVYECVLCTQCHKKHPCEWYNRNMLEFKGWISTWSVFLNSIYFLRDHHLYVMIASTNEKSSSVWPGPKDTKDTVSLCLIRLSQLPLPHLLLL